MGTRRQNDVRATSLRRIDVVTTSCACWELGPPLAPPPPPPPPQYSKPWPPNILNLPTPMITLNTERVLTFIGQGLSLILAKFSHISTTSNTIASKSTMPIGSKFHMELSWTQKTDVYSNRCRQMANVAKQGYKIKIIK